MPYLNEIRHNLSIPPVVVSTVSTQLRNLAYKGLLQAVEAETTVKPKHSRGMLAPTTRSPNTSYVTKYTKTEVMQKLFSDYLGMYTDKEVAAGLPNVDFNTALESRSDSKLALEQQRQLFKQWESDIRGWGL